MMRCSMGWLGMAGDVADVSGFRQHVTNCNCGNIGSLVRSYGYGRSDVPNRNKMETHHEEDYQRS